MLLCDRECLCSAGRTRHSRRTIQLKDDQMIFLVDILELVDRVDWRVLLQTTLICVLDLSIFTSLM